ncbi:L-azetidine-2-carboxylic acid acetyltransferase OS=Schizosaccharomyces pombe (strain 972 / ATCC 24843) GN=ppr1 PE=1 SV=1 [Rhizoctonia solani AG-1 IB]|uniref:L-azetidine-2-carboxylic acid acetyltransferase n=1 Tax=Thanatephorus cucumeris (strain AG1-IB / isolate 7/3/14) TaxID=1108050 RepID=A0A0B7FI29_THACB|nr:L-azetidine-2-carboxylic acid acetyltransferase OS=Schizosaccharomyces pombe (strain 972 / ATCC 24843) GN=ppr1 PE=1 SV=1 [Rhizoctonia solani AG-1 IB]
MSAYGAIAVPSNRSKDPLKTLSYVSKQPENSILVVHLTQETVPSDLVELLHKEFEQELERGQTYPQEGPMDLATFQAYFFAADVFVGLIVPSGEAAALQTGDIERIRAGRNWDECIVGSYYVKPNYPGRSSHICNAGFVVRLRFRRLGLGNILGESYVRNAPQLGYKASVFNLVYANNLGSLAIWDRLGFTRAGLIPKAGRLRTESGEEYFDAVVVYKSFED